MTISLFCAFSVVYSNKEKSNKGNKSFYNDHLDIVSLSSSITAPQHTVYPIIILYETFSVQCCTAVSCRGQLVRSVLSVFTIKNLLNKWCSSHTHPLCRIESFHIGSSVQCKKRLIRPT